MTAILCSLFVDRFGNLTKPNKELAMKKTVQWIVASIGLSLFAAASAGPIVQAKAEVSGTNAEVPGTTTEVPGTNKEIPGTNDQVVRSASIIITTYFSDATHTTQVGSCVLSTCPGTKGRHCTGTMTSFTEVDTDTCN
jgi:hypothetical protein